MLTGMSNGLNGNTSSAGTASSSSAPFTWQNDLCGKRLNANLVEWCDTPVVRSPGFATTDGCWKFDETDGTFAFRRALCCK